MATTKVYTSPEYDSALTGSVVTSIDIDFTKSNPSDSIEIAFRASDTPDDPLANSQWTSYATIDTQGENSYSSLGLNDVVGRYKQVRIRMIKT